MYISAKARVEKLEIMKSNLKSKSKETKEFSGKVNFSKATLQFSSWYEGLKWFVLGISNPKIKISSHMKN